MERAPPVALAKRAWAGHHPKSHVHVGRIFGFVLFLLPMFAASAAAHWFIVAWAMRAFPRLARYRRAAKIVVGIVVVAGPLMRAVARRAHSSILGEILALLLVEAMFVLMSLPLLAIAIAGARLLSRRTAAPALEAPAVEAPATLAPDATATAGAAIADTATALADPDEAPKVAAPVVSPPSPLFGRREALERAGGLLALGATGSILGWGILRGRHAFQIDEVVVRIPGLPKALDGYTIVQVSDLHAGINVNERDLKEGLDRVAEARPDLIVATGDLVDFDPDCAPMLARALGSLRARDGVFAIPGNHDYYSGVGEVLAALGKTQVEVLMNRGRVIRPGDGGGFALLGVDDMWGQRSGGPGPDLDAAIAQVPADLPRILLAHQPNFIRASAGTVALQLSGHTHGGQINPGFTPAKLFMPFVAGRYDVDGTVLYVNRGFGVVGPPARVGAPPEVTRVVLVSS